MKVWLKKLLMLPVLLMFGFDPFTLAALLLSSATAANNAGWFGKEEEPGPGYHRSQFLPQPEQKQKRPVRGYEGRGLMDILSLMGRR